MQRWDVGLERLRYETRKQLPDCGQQRRRLTYSVLTEGQRNIWWVNVNSKAYRFLILSTVTRWQSFLPLKEKAKFHYALFSENGFDKKIIDRAAENETQLYTLNQIVHYA